MFLEEEFVDVVVVVFLSILSSYSEGRRAKDGKNASRGVTIASGASQGRVRGALIQIECAHVDMSYVLNQCNSASSLCYTYHQVIREPLYTC